MPVDYSTHSNADVVYRNYAPNIGMIEATKRYFARYADFSGRSSRAEYWWPFLSIGIISVLTLFLDGMLVDNRLEVTPFNWVWSLVCLLPGIAVSVRRLHDTDRSGWWLLIALIPFVGAIVLIVWYCTEGMRQPNRFG
jgi:uncharacterized membrane protein YhaH (DUF805 family)